MKFTSLPAVVTMAAALVFVLSPAHAVDTIQSKDAPDLSAPRAKIKASDFQGAAADLHALIEKGTLHADVYSLLGFSLRKSGDMTNAQIFYKKALEFDPDHMGALEYQGEMFVELGQLTQARENLARLVRLCPKGCEERDDLEKALARAPRG